MDAFDPEAAARAVADSLRALGIPERAAGEKAYLKSDLEFFGVTVPDIRRTVRAAVRSHQGLDREAMLAWAAALWREPVHERRMVAVELLTLAARQLTADDLPAVAKLLRESGTWALVDGLACNAAGAIALRDPSSWPLIDAWAADPEFWVRRSALLPGIRAGRRDLARVTRYAEPMLAEREFFIRKAIGWVLREISRRDPEWVAGWTARHVRDMSGITFREAVRRLPAGDAERLRALRAAPGPVA